MSVMASQITSLKMFIQLFIQAQIKENIKAQRHWPLWGEFTGDWEFPAQRASYAENVSIWWNFLCYMQCHIKLTVNVVISQDVNYQFCNNQYKCLIDNTRGLSAYIARWLLELWQIL